MYLKSIDIHGFKSFAEKTVLEFLPPQKKEAKQSITAIVGPNGSGKSNVSDAIRWVLGEQRMTQLRGKKGADIIFAGSEGKGQMSVASVLMTLDNSDGRVPIEYEEVVIGRKYYRSGESEYVINGNSVRLIDLQLLLAKAQFGQGSYSVVGQGMIDKLILQTPQERKAFFDEAAGIKEFQIKRHQAWLKLNRSREHISQAELLLGEISPRLKTLTRQVKKLEERQSVEQELRESQEQYYVTLHNHHQSGIQVHQTLLAESDEMHTSLQQELLAIQEELAALAKEASRQDVFAALQQEYQDVQKKKNDHERELAILKGRLQTAYSQAGKHQVGWLESKVDTLASDVGSVAKDLKGVKDSIRETAEAVQGLQKNIQEKELERTELAAKIVNAEQRARDVQHEQSYRQYTGIRAVEAVLSERHAFPGDVYGTVAQLGRVDTKYTTALDAAAGGRLSSLVVATDRVAEACIQFLRREQFGYATFLPLNKIRERPLPGNMDQYMGMPGVHGFAIDLVRFEQKFFQVFSYVLGGTLIVDDIATAREVGIGRVRMVTLTGDILETSGSMKGGYRKRKTSDLSFANSGFYESQQDSDAQMQNALDMKKELEVIEQDLRDCYGQKQTYAVTQESLSNKRALLEEKKHALDAEQATLKQELSLHTMSKSDYDATMKDLDKERKDVEQQLEDVEKVQLSIEKKIAKFNEDEEKKKQRIFDLQNAMQEKQTALNTVTESRNKAQVEIAKLETKVEDLEHELYQELHMSAASLSKSIESSLTIEQLEAVQQQIQKLKYKLSLIGGIDEEVVQEYEETKARHEGLSEQLDDLGKTIKDMELLIAELDEVMRKKRNKAFREIKKEFKRYFEILFEGGQADLVEVYGDEKKKSEDEESGEGEEVVEEVVEEDEKSTKKKRGKKILAGIDIKACPPGKKIKNIQVLSGGERTMTSIALICAILHTNPPPFVVLDEVEAALDEANTIRFTSILHELSLQSQFILITHNKATMHAADALYGVTMGQDGVSKLLSVKLEDAKKTVDA